VEWRQFLFQEIVLPERLYFRANLLRTTSVNLYPEKTPATYLMSNKYHGVIYVGVTSNLLRRVYEHKYSQKSCFTKKYNCKNLVYYELHETMIDAITREKQLKSGSRKKKIKLIEKENPNWNDLYDMIIEQ